jgi:hypothetical protein
LFCIVTNIRTLCGLFFRRELVLIAALTGCPDVCRGVVRVDFPASDTGATVLTPLDGAWCVQPGAERLAVGAWPAPYGIVALSRGTLGVPLLGSYVMLGGGSGGGWTQVEVCGLRSFQVTEVFQVGAVAGLGWASAKGFSSRTSASIGVQGRVLLDSVWTLGMAVDNLVFLSSWRGPPPRSVRIGCSWTGACVLAADVLLRTASPAALLLSAMVPLADEVMVRAAVLTEPIGVEMSVRLSTVGFGRITAVLGTMLESGFTSGLVLEW